MEGRSIFPALMPFLYFQQGLFEDHSDTLEGEANAYGLPEVNTSNHAAVPASEVDEEGDLQRRLRALRAQRAEWGNLKQSAEPRMTG
eukprot:symbB.v1.2.028983.t1/scaffold3124.1/size63071/3